ncbi:MAG: hypothetical protein WAV76_08770, partial [Bacteroidota bacterium]
RHLFSTHEFSSTSLDGTGDVIQNDDDNQINYLASQSALQFNVIILANLKNCFFTVSMSSADWSGRRRVAKLDFGV